MKRNQVWCKLTHLNGYIVTIDCDEPVECDERQINAVKENEDNILV